MSDRFQPGVRYFDKAEAQKVYAELLAKNGIPETSTTAKCMFYQTNSSRGHQCQFGLTPLWDNEMKKVEGKVLHSEFMDMAHRLVDAGLTRQGRG